MNSRNGEACRRLASAVVDGRYLEDPEVWREHVEACPSCRELVDGLRTLRSRIDHATERVRENGLPPDEGADLIAEAFRRYRRLRRVQGLTLGVVALIGLALGLVFLVTGQGESPADTPRAYARVLHDRVFGEDGQPDYALLRRDEGLQAEYRAALDHESSLVRRVALQALMFSGVPIASDRLERILTTWDEDLEAPLEVAAQGDGRRHLEDALAQRRVATLGHVLSGASVQAASGGPRVDSAVIEPYVDHPDPGVRACALHALSGDPAFRSGDRILRRLRVEEDAQVAKFAARLVLDRLGAEGVEAVVARLRERRDWGLEGYVLDVLGDASSSVALSRERVLDGSVPPALALHHLRRLVRLGEVVPAHDSLFERALHDQDPRSWEALADYAAEEDLVAYRKALQARWQACPAGSVRTRLAIHLVGWDCACTEEGRQQLALDVLDIERDPRLRPYAERLSTSDHPAVRARARQLLADW